jgi:hypothetical protein
MQACLSGIHPCKLSFGPRRAEAVFSVPSTVARAAASSRHERPNLPAAEGCVEFLASAICSAATWLSAWAISSLNASGTASKHAATRSWTGVPNVSSDRRVARNAFMRATSPRIGKGVGAVIAPCSRAAQRFLPRHLVAAVRVLGLVTRCSPRGLQNRWQSGMRIAHMATQRGLDCCAGCQES